MISAIIVAAGSSRRMGFDKLSADLGGRPVIAHSIQAFQECPEVSEIIVVTSADRFRLIEQHQTSKVTHVIEGGSERHLSVWNGLQTSSADLPLVSVHDGARPLISPSAITKCAEIASQKGAATLAHRVVDTLKRSTPGGTIAAESINRENIWAMETPQIFDRNLLCSAYNQIITSQELVTDEVSAMQKAGHEVHFVENSEQNFKITVSGDLVLAETLLAPK